MRPKAAGRTAPRQYFTTIARSCLWLSVLGNTVSRAAVTSHCSLPTPYSLDSGVHQSRGVSRNLPRRSGRFRFVASGTLSSSNERTSKCSFESCLMGAPTTVVMKAFLFHKDAEAMPFFLCPCGSGPFGTGSSTPSFGKCPIDASWHSEDEFMTVSDRVRIV